MTEQRSSLTYEIWQAGELLAVRGSLFLFEVAAVGDR